MTSDRIDRWRHAAQGQFLERKSAWERSGQSPKNRKAADVARDIAETLAAMANADGGELVVGIEDDGAVTGVPHPEDKINLFLGVPGDTNYVKPALPCSVREIQTENGLRLLHFEVTASVQVHQLADGRYLLRIRDRNEPFLAEQIAALKQTKEQGLFEAQFPPAAGVEDLDHALMAEVTEKVGVPGTPHDLLSRYHLADERTGAVAPNMAGLLLFAKDPGQWHSRCGIDFVRWSGTERKSGPEFNIAKRIRVEAPLARLIEDAYKAISPHIRERQQLLDLFFTEHLEYPTFVWQEGIVNAVTHRDYSIQGACIEVWMFDDRMEIRSPGLPPQPLTIEVLQERKHAHLSRNPLIARVLSDLGYVREQGEGIPRMFSLMEEQGFYPPRLEAIGTLTFQVTLFNQPVYDQATLRWLRQYDSCGLSGDQKRILVYAHTRGDTFTSQDYQKQANLDIYEASKSIKDLIRRGVVRRNKKGGRVYQVMAPIREQPSMPETLRSLIPTLSKKREIVNEDIRKVLGVSRPQATRIAAELRAAGWLEAVGTCRWTRYRLRRNVMSNPSSKEQAR